MFICNPEKLTEAELSVYFIRCYSKELCDYLIENGEYPMTEALVDDEGKTYWNFPRTKIISRLQKQFVRDSKQGGDIW